MSDLRAILIIGATRGIGLELVNQALSAYPSATVYATARDPAKAQDLQLVADKSKGRVQIVSADANDANSLHLAAIKIKESTNVLDVVIYNAGVLKGFGNILDVGIDALKDNINTNVYGAYYAAVEFTPFVLRSEYGKKTLVLLTTEFASMGLSDQILSSHEAAFGVSGFDPTAMYNVSKTALNRLGKELDNVLGPQGLPVLLVHPGLVKTEMNAWGNIDTVESATGIVNVIRSFKAGKKNFIGWNGEDLPW